MVYERIPDYNWVVVHPLYTPNNQVVFIAHLNFQLRSCFVDNLIFVPGRLVALPMKRYKIDSSDGSDSMQQMVFSRRAEAGSVYLKQRDNPQKTIMRANCYLYHGFCNPVYSEVAYSLINQPTTRACFMAHGGTKNTEKFQMHAWIPDTPLNKPACGEKSRVQERMCPSHTIRQCDHENSLVDFVGEKKPQLVDFLELAGDISLRC